MTTMGQSIESQLLERLRALPLEKRREVLDFAAFLARQPANDEPVHRESIFEFIATLPAGTRSKEDIDNQLKEERASWGDR